MNTNRSGNIQKNSESDDSESRHESRPTRNPPGKGLLQIPLDQSSGKGENRKIKIQIKSYDTKILDETVRKMSDTLRKLGLMFAGPIPLPVKRSFTTVLKSPHVHKDARQVFEMREKKRIIEIVESKSAIAALNEMKHTNPSISIAVEFINKGGRRE
jgi:small subunit ribosomal protein S10